MRTINLILSLAVFVGCSSKQNTPSARSRFDSGAKLMSLAGSCNAHVDSKTSDGYFAFEKEAFIMKVNQGECQAKIKYSFKWLTDSRLQIWNPQAIESCKGLKLDPRTKLNYDFVKASSPGFDISLFSSHRPGCRPLRWQEG